MDANLYYYLIYIVLAIGILFALNLFRSHLGRAFIAVRDRDIAAEIIGINIFRTKLVAFGIASFYAGITGVLYTYFYSIANFESFTLLISIQFLAMCIIGGLGSILGSILGAVFITMLPIVLDFILRGVGGAVFGWDDADGVGHHAPVEPHHVRRPHHVLPGRRARRAREDVAKLHRLLPGVALPYV